MKAGIAGAGIMGKLLALALQNAGWEVTLFDPNADNNCSRAAAGLLTPVSELEKNPSLIYQLGCAAISHYWPKILAQFQEKIYFQTKGTLVLAHPRDRSELIRVLQIIKSKLPDQIFYKSLNNEQIKNLEPEITQFSEGFFFPEEAQLDNQHVLAILEKYLNKTTWQKSFIKQVLPNQIITDTDIFNFDMVFDCRGLGAKTIFNDLRSVRGELIWLKTTEVNLTRPVRLMHPRYSLYVVPRPGNIYIVGASEIEMLDMSEITVRTVLELLTGVYSIHPGFSEAKIIKMVTHCRPTLVDHLPKIKFNKGLIAINGLYRHGFLIAPSLVEEVMQFLTKGFSAVKFPELWEDYV